MKRSDKTFTDKSALILRLILSVVVIIMAFLKLTDIWDKALNVAIPLLGLVILIQSIGEWKRHKGAAILGFCTAIFISISFCVVWFLK